MCSRELLSFAGRVTPRGNAAVPGRMMIGLLLLVAWTRGTCGRFDHRVTGRGRASSALAARKNGRQYAFHGNTLVPENAAVIDPVTPRQHCFTNSYRIRQAEILLVAQVVVGSKHQQVDVASWGLQHTIRSCLLVDVCIMYQAVNVFSQTYVTSTGEELQAGQTLGSAGINT